LVVDRMSIPDMTMQEWLPQVHGPDAPVKAPGQDHWWPIGPARPFKLNTEEVLDAAVVRAVLDAGCPVCGRPVAYHDTAHPECRTRHAGKWTYRDDDKKGRGKR
jgi:hypothetical protein